MNQAKPRYIYPSSTGATDSTNQEEKDCVVRAFANATGKSYVESHAIFANAGRISGKGTRTATIPDVMHQHGFTSVLLGYSKTANEVSCYNKNISVLENAVSVGKLLATPRYSKGTHVFVYRGHAFAVIDGKIIDKSIIKQGRIVFMIFSKI